MDNAMRFLMVLALLGIMLGIDHVFDRLAVEPEYTQCYGMLTTGSVGTIKFRFCTRPTGGR